MKNLIFRPTCILLFLLSFACNEEEIVPTENQSAFELKYFAINPKIDFSTTYDLSKVKLEDVISESISELYKQDLSDINNRGSKSEDVVVMIDFIISKNQVTVTPSSYARGIEEESDDSKCGGQAGDGWKSYDVCYSEECVRAASVQAANDLSLRLTAGMCMDIRVKRNTLSARVCGRIVSC
ncbi:MAG: hypothetical protein ACSHXF_05865 [Aquaticitalea sp.]